MSKYIILEVNDSFDPNTETIFDALDKGAQWMRTLPKDPMDLLSVVDFLPPMTEWEERNLVGYDDEVKTRARVEMAIVRKLVVRLITLGYRITVDDGGETPVMHSADVDDILDNAFATDATTLKVYTADNHFRGSIDLVFGNSGYDVVSDHSASLSELLEPIDKYADELSELF